MSLSGSLLSLNKWTEAVPLPTEAEAAGNGVSEVEYDSHKIGPCDCACQLGGSTVYSERATSIIKFQYTLDSYYYEYYSQSSSNPTNHSLDYSNTLQSNLATQSIYSYSQPKPNPNQTKQSAISSTKTYTTTTTTTDSIKTSNAPSSSTNSTPKVASSSQYSNTQYWMDKLNYPCPKENTIKIKNTKDKDKSSTQTPLSYSTQCTTPDSEVYSKTDSSYTDYDTDSKYVHFHNMRPTTFNTTTNNSSNANTNMNMNMNMNMKTATSKLKSTTDYQSSSSTYTSTPTYTPLNEAGSVHFHDMTYPTGSSTRMDQSGSRSGSTKTSTQPQDSYYDYNYKFKVVNKEGEQNSIPDGLHFKQQILSGDSVENLACKCTDAHRAVYNVYPIKNNKEFFSNIRNKQIQGKKIQYTFPFKYFRLYYNSLNHKNSNQ